MNSFEAMAIRIENAHTSFVSDVVEQFQFTQEQAEKILSIYQRAKIVKTDPIMGRVMLSHGAYWDKEVMTRALEAYK